MKAKKMGGRPRRRISGKSVMDRVAKVEESQNNVRWAIWALLFGLVAVTVALYGVQAGLWEANDALWRVI